MRLKVLLFAGIASISAISCSQTYYSCDKEINTWAEEHINLYESGTRCDIVSLPLGRQYAIYTGLSPERKCELWKAKITMLIDEKTSTAAEKDVLSEFLLFLSPDLYDDSDTDSLAIELEQSLRSRLGWDSERFFYSLCTWMTREEYETSVALDHPIQTKSGPIGEEPEEKPFCDCSAMLTSCAATMTTCNTHADCKEKKGCGVGGIGICRGVCE